ncbi:cryptochrome/photolyase family protein [Flavisphingomonas formosensis]|uniref:cryptochrome/photolyase family protein n=1 Tax=Flavisphingomonas formosensis TaxID=861534 RepID=UPI0012F84E54|nr:deoxyribodipyrimidine photo-lyase [Sphingomonas formosensis]
MTAPVILWFRQDLRLSDQPALLGAAASGPVIPVYILDDAAPGDWRIGAAQRWWLHHSLAALEDRLREKGLRLILRRGDAVKEIAKLAGQAGAASVHALRHYEPWWKKAEEALAGRLDLCLYDGGQLLPPDRVLTGSQGRFRMFTPFWRAALRQLPPPEAHRAPAKIEAPSHWPHGDQLADWDLRPTHPDWAKGFEEWTPGEEGARAALDAFLPELGDYDHARNLPSVEGTSRLSPHLHFGEISPAQVWHRASKAAHARAEPFLRQLVWRDFATNIVDILPDYAYRNGRPTFDRLPWRSGKTADADFRAWTTGRTGYPIVDAGMRQLWATGWMHNRVRMIVASFLTRHLLLDWRRGERWFWDTLVDADYGNNAVNWQWVAGTGVDANMFGRIMTPIGQSGKFDAAGYIRDWVPELADLSDATIHDPHAAGCALSAYPKQIVGHREGRERALAAQAKIR